MSYNTVIHNFQDSLNGANTLEADKKWIAFYKALFPEMIHCVRLDAYSAFQKWGIDREILLPNGIRITVDEKLRDTTFDDILIEEWSVGHYVDGQYIGKKLGWSLDPEKRCDYIAYAIPKIGKCYFIPFDTLRRTCVKNIEKWKQIKIKGIYPSYPKDSPNDGYYTRNVAVEWHVLKENLLDQIVHGFKHETDMPAYYIDDLQ